MNDVDIARCISRQHNISWYYDHDITHNVIFECDLFVRHISDHAVPLAEYKAKLNVIMTKKCHFIYLINNTGVIL